MQVSALTRAFTFNAIKLADPGSAMSPTDVRDFYSAAYPDLANAEVEGPKRVGDVDTYTFRRAVGTKGATGTRRAVKPHPGAHTFIETARAAIDRQLGRDGITIRPGVRRATAIVARLANSTHRDKAPRVAAPSALLPLLP